MADEETEEREDVGRPVVIERNVVDIAGTKYVALPQEWIKKHKIEKGDKVVVVANRDVRICSPDSAADVYRKVTAMVQEADTAPNPESGTDKKQESDKKQQPDEPKTG